MAPGNVQIIKKQLFFMCSNMLTAEEVTHLNQELTHELLWIIVKLAIFVFSSSCSSSNTHLCVLLHINTETLSASPLKRAESG